jgi:hypothetical protein
MDAALAARYFMRDPRLGNAAPNSEIDQLVMPLAARLAIVDDGNQLPGLVIEELSPLDTEMPLPPSTMGRTSRPEIISDSRDFTSMPTPNRNADDRRPATVHRSLTELKVRYSRFQ